MNENAIAKIVVDCCVRIHKKLGPGLLESVYKVVLMHELRKSGLHVEHEVPINIKYDGIEFESAFSADLIVENKVIIELKSVEELHEVHKAQLLTYLRLTEMKLGILINFGEVLVKDGIKRVINGVLED